MLGLLTPAFLIGIAALSVPIIIHLIRRERHDAVQFPSLMFLSKIPQRTVKRRHIRNWWLFALRCLALLLLVGAFARPYLDRPNINVSAVAAAREVVIMVDRSYSMGYGDRWQRALASAREAVEALGSEDRATIVFFDASAHAATQPTTDKTQLRLALDSARVGSGATRYAPALKLAQSILGASQLPRREAVLISDFQRSGWDGASGAQLPTGAVLRPVHVGAGAASNLIVTNVTLQRARVTGRERVTATVQLANRSEAPARGVRVALVVDGRTVQTTQADVPANGTSSVALEPLTLGDVVARATVTAGTDALSADNSFHFTLEPEPGLRVLVLEPGGREASLYLRQALELAQDPPVTLTVRREGVPNRAELDRTDVVILNDVLPPDGDAGQRLTDWVRAGGGLLHALGDRTAAGWTGTARELAGGAPDRVVDRIDGGGGRLGYIDYSHEIFELFRSPRGGGFTGARFYRYRPVPVTAAATADTVTKTAVLARFDDGAVALLERQLGAGRALVWSSTLDAYWSSFPLEPAYLPFVLQVVRYAAGHAPQRAWHTAGQVVDIAAGSEAALVVGTPGGKRVDVAAGNSLITLQEQGVYEVRDAREPNTRPRLYAVNLDVTESDLTPLDPAELVSAVTLAGAVSGAAERISLPPEEQERRQRLWWYLLVIAFALLTAEAVFANRRSPRPA
jgi:hypothetical protein